MFGSSKEKRIIREADKIASLKEDMGMLSWSRVMEIGKRLQETSVISEREELAQELISIAQSNITLASRLGIDATTSNTPVMPSGVEVLKGGYAEAALVEHASDDTADVSAAKIEAAQSAPVTPIESAVSTAPVAAAPAPVDEPRKPAWVPSSDWTWADLETSIREENAVSITDIGEVDETAIEDVEPAIKLPSLKIELPSRRAAAKKVDEEAPVDTLPAEGIVSSFDIPVDPAAFAVREKQPVVEAVTEPEPEPIAEVAQAEEKAEELVEAVAESEAEVEPQVVAAVEAVPVDGVVEPATELEPEPQVVASEEVTPVEAAVEKAESLEVTPLEVQETATSATKPEAPAESKPIMAAEPVKVTKPVISVPPIAPKPVESRKVAAKPAETTTPDPVKVAVSGEKPVRTGKHAAPAVPKPEPAVRDRHARQPEKDERAKVRFARFRNLYESRDGGLTVFEDEQGHLTAVKSSKLA